MDKIPLFNFPLFEGDIERVRSDDRCFACKRKDYNSSLKRGFGLSLLALMD